MDVMAFDKAEKMLVYIIPFLLQTRMMISRGLGFISGYSVTK